MRNPETPLTHIEQEAYTRIRQLAEYTDGVLSPTDALAAICAAGNTHPDEILERLILKRVCVRRGEHDSAHLT